MSSVAAKQAPAIALPGRTADLTADLTLADPEPAELPDEPLLELPADALIELPPLNPTGEVAEALDLGSAVLGSEAWRASIGAPDPTPAPAIAPAPVAPASWPPPAETPAETPARKPLCDNLAGLRFGPRDSAPANDSTIDVPRTPPPPPRRIEPPAMAPESSTRPLPEIVHVRKTPAHGVARPEVGAPTVVGLDEAPARKAKPRSPTPRPVTMRRQIREVGEGQSDDLPTEAPRREASPRHRKADGFYEEALKSMAAQDYASAFRHLTLALTFAPGDPRFITARQKVQRILSL